MAEEQHVLLLTVHHIISDGWSIGVISDELGRHYEAACRRSQVCCPSCRCSMPTSRFGSVNGFRMTPLLASCRIGAIGWPIGRFWKCRRIGRGRQFRRHAATSNRSCCPRRSRTPFRRWRAEATLFMVSLAALKILLQPYTTGRHICGLAGGGPLAH